MGDSVTVGFVGLGMMGAGMAANLQRAGVRLVVHDLRQASAERHLAAGAVWAGSPRALAEQAEIVFTSLPTPPDVEAVVTGPDGLLAGMRSGTVLADLSTNSVQMVRKLHALLAPRGVELLDAPVSGGAAGAVSGKLAIWVGGADAAFARIRPQLEAMGDEVRHIGPIGAGTIAKLVHNCSSAMVAVALAEVFTMGIKAGLDPLPLWEAVRQGASGRQRTFDAMASQFLTGNYDNPGFTLRLMRKDVSLAVELAKEVAVPMQVAEYTLSELAAAEERGWGGLASRVAMKLQQERAGIAPLEVDPKAIRQVMQGG